MMTGVLFTFGALTAPAPSFSGDVYVVTGDKDYIFALGNAYAVPPGASQNNILDYVSDLYPSASKFATLIPANTGHGISAHLSAPETYAQVNTWLSDNF